MISERKIGARLVARARGFTLLEAMVLMVILSIVSLGVGVGLQASIKAPETTDRALAISEELISELDTYRSQASLTSNWIFPSPYTINDTVTIKVGGQSFTYPRVTVIQTWDPNNLTTNTSPKTDFAQVKITINNSQTAFIFVSRPT
jgi:type II secretory pathway pseudopilin PulG